MKMATTETARKFLNAVELPPSPLGAYEGAGEIIDFNAQKNQAMIVASDVISFVKGVTSERREAIVNASLLAQLLANKKVPNKLQIIDWYNTYFDALENIGWVVQDRSFSTYTQDANGLEAHEAVLKVAAVLLGGSPAALAVITSTLEALKSMDSSKPWITIFDRETKDATMGHFQIALAEQDDAGQFVVSLMAFSLRAKANLTQVLFFKIRNDEVELKKYSGKVTINDAVLSSVSEKIKQKIASHANSYIASLPDFA